MDEDVPLIETRAGGVLTITLNRPHDRNGMNSDMLSRLHGALKAAATDNGVRVVVIKGAGDHFSPGASMGAVGRPNTMSAAELDASLAQLAEIGLLANEMPKPTIALLRGSVAGGGIALAASCDFRIATTTLRIGFGYSRIGLAGDLGASLFLTRLLGQKARGFMMLAPVLSGDEALSMGLVDRLVADDALEAEGDALVASLLKVSPQALAGVKQNIRAAQNLSAREALEIEARNFALAREGAAHKEAVRAFIEKREPVFGPDDPVNCAPWPDVRHAR